MNEETKTAGLGRDTDCGMGERRDKSTAGMKRKHGDRRTGGDTQRLQD